MTMMTTNELNNRKKMYADMKKDGPVKRARMYRERALRHLDEIRLHLLVEIEDDVNWSHVGTLSHYTDQVQEVADSIMKRGEYT